MAYSHEYYEHAPPSLEAIADRLSEVKGRRLELVPCDLAHVAFKGMPPDSDDGGSLAELLPRSNNGGGSALLVTA